RVVAGTPHEDVVTITAILRELDHSRAHARRGDYVITVERTDSEPVVCRLGTRDVDSRVQAGDAHAGGVPADHDGVVSIGAFDDHGVHRTVAAASAGRKGDVDLGDIGAREVVDGDHIGTAECIEVDPLHAVQIHHDARDVTGESHP